MTEAMFKSFGALTSQLSSCITQSASQTRQTSIPRERQPFPRKAPTSQQPNLTKEDKKGADYVLFMELPSVIREQELTS